MQASGTHPLQSRQTLEKRHGDRTRTAHAVHERITPTASREASRSPTPDDSRRWVLAGLRAYERFRANPASYCPLLPGQFDQCHHGVRSRLPLRGSPGILNRVPIFSLCECAGTNTPTAIGGALPRDQHNILGYPADLRLTLRKALRIHLCTGQPANGRRLSSASKGDSGALTRRARAWRCCTGSAWGARSHLRRAHRRAHPQSKFWRIFRCLCSIR